MDFRKNRVKSEKNLFQSGREVRKFRCACRKFWRVPPKKKLKMIFLNNYGRSHCRSYFIM